MRWFWAPIAFFLGRCFPVGFFWFVKKNSRIYSTQRPRQGVTADTRAARTLEAVSAQLAAATVFVNWAMCTRPPFVSKKNGCKHLKINIWSRRGHQYRRLYDPIGLLYYQSSGIMSIQRIRAHVLKIKSTVLWPNGWPVKCSSESRQASLEYKWWTRSTEPYCSAGEARLLPSEPGRVLPGGGQQQGCQGL